MLGRPKKKRRRDGFAAVDGGGRSRPWRLLITTKVRFSKEVAFFFTLDGGGSRRSSSGSGWVQFNSLNFAFFELFFNKKYLLDFKF